MIQVHYFYCALYFYYCCISSTSGRQALDPGVWGPLIYRALPASEPRVKLVKVSVLFHAF